MTENKRFENRLNKENVKFNTQNPVWDNKREDALNVFEMIEELNALHEENQELRKDVIYWRHKALNEEPVNCRCEVKYND